MIRKICSILIVFMFILVSFEEGLTQSQSQYALIRKPIFTNPFTYKLTKSFAWNEWGTQLFVDCQSVAQSYIISPDSLHTLYSAVSFHLDNGWHRMLFQECTENWIAIACSLGSGVGEFHWPSKLDAEALCNRAHCDSFYFVYVADAGNNRIAKLRYNWVNPSLDWLGTITGGGLDNPQDLDMNNGGTFYGNSDDYLWVLNGQQIKRFTMDGTLHCTYGNFNCNPNGVGNFCRPTAVACGRSPWLQPPKDQFANGTLIYVADAGNSRLVSLMKWTGSEDIYWNKTLQAPECQFFADLDVDNFGQVWAVDEENGRIYKYTDDLYPLCYYGSFGTNDGQFYFPYSFFNTGGYLGCGDASVAESWTDNSGGQYFTIGTDILDFEVSSSVDYQYHYIDYTLVDPSIVTIKIYNQQDQLMKTLLNTGEFSGACAHVWNGTNASGQQVATGEYKVVLVDTCIYGDIETDQPVNVVTKEAWVHHAAPGGDAPWNLVANQTGPDKVTLNWEYYSNKSSDQFTIYCDGCLCGNAWGIGGGTYTDSGLVPNRSYVYWVKLYEGGNESPPSNADTVSVTSLLFAPSFNGAFPLQQNLPEFSFQTSEIHDTAHIEMIYNSGYPGHTAEMQMRLKTPEPVCGFNFLIKLSGAPDLLNFHTNNISKDSILINSNWLHYSVRECSIDTIGSLINGWSTLSCRGQVSDTSSSHCKYLWVKDWASPDNCITADTTYRILFKFGIDALCFPDSATNRSIFFDLPFARLYSSNGEEIPFMYYGDEFMLLYSVPGDVNGDSLVNAGDVISLINYLFRNGPRPCIIETADPTGNCVSDAGDVISLISYLFRGGVAPYPGCWYGK